MPALPPVPNVLKLEILYSMSTDLSTSNRLFFRYGGTPPTNQSLFDWINNNNGLWQTHIMPSTHPDTAVVGWRAQDLTSPTSAAAEVVVQTAGSAGGVALPAGVAMLVNYTVQRRYRGGKPRTYVQTGTSLDVGDEQHWSATFRTNFETQWNQFIAAMMATPPAGTTLTSHVSVSYYQGFTTTTGSTGRVRNVSTPRATPVIDVITTSKCDARFASQRRRNRP